MKIRILRDNRELARYRLDEGEYLVGSGGTAHLRLDDAGIAPEHARIKIGTDGVKVEDLGSGFTTRLGELVVTGVQPVPAGARLQLGGLAVEFLDDTARTTAQTRPEASGKNSSEAPGRYVVGDIVAKGAMGVIRRARELNTGRDVAMKQMHDSLEQGDAALAARFVQEAKITAHLEHPNVVPVHDVSPGADGRRFYTMKMVRGISLEKVIVLLHTRAGDALKKYPLEALLIIFQKVCDALAFAHSKGVIHRDLKPANIMVGAYGEVLVMDWGLAKTLNDDGGSPSTFDIGDSDFGGTLAGSVMGTPFYMAPEQAMGDVAHVDARSDVYALGAILFELLTLLPPVEGKNTRDVLARVREGKITPPQQRIGTALLPHLPGGKIPPSLAAVVAKAMSFSPGRRYQRVEDLQAEILAYQAGRATSAEDAGAWRQFTLLVKRNKAVSTAIAASLAILTALSVIYTAAVVHERDRTAAALAQVEPERQRANTERDKATAALEQANVEKKKAEDALVQANTEKERADTERNKATTALARVEEERKRTDAERGRAEGALTRLKGTAPTFMAEAQKFIELQQVPEALERLDSAVAVDPQNFDAHLRRARLLTAALKIKEAVPAYERALAIRPNPAASGDLALCKRILQVDDGRSSLPDNLVIELYRRLKSQGLQAELAILKPFVFLKNEDQDDIVIQTRFRAWKSSKGWGDNRERITHNTDGSYSLNLSGLALADLSPLSGLQIKALNLQQTNAADLGPLKDAPLEELILDDTAITDLGALKGMKLRLLSINRTPVKSLAPLSGMSLERFTAHLARNIDNLEPLRGAPLAWVDIGGTSVRDLTPIDNKLLAFLCIGTPRTEYASSNTPSPFNTVQSDGTSTASGPLKLDGLKISPLVILQASNSYLLTDLGALRGKPLKIVDLSDCTRIQDLSPLAACPTLEEIRLPDHRRLSNKVAKPWVSSVGSLRVLKKLKGIAYGSYGALQEPNSFFADYDRDHPH